jgi:hypothetical protein
MRKRATALLPFQVYKTELISSDPLEIRESYVQVNPGDEVECDGGVTVYSLFGAVYDVSKDGGHAKVPVECIKFEIL